MTETIPLDPALDHLREHLPTAIEGRDPEGVHQVRVAARRLGVWLELAERRALVGDLRWLRRVAGEIRDLDVLTMLDLPERLNRDLVSKRTAAHAQLVVELEGPRCVGLLNALEQLQPLSARRASKGVVRLFELVRRRGRRVDRVRKSSTAQRTRLHALRRASRRLRYAREWIGERDRRLKRLQSTLGQLNDLDQLQRRLTLITDRELLDDFARELAVRTDEAQIDALAAWRACRGELLAEFAGRRA